MNNIQMDYILECCSFAVCFLFFVIQGEREERNKTDIT